LNNSLRLLLQEWNKTWRWQDVRFGQWVSNTYIAQEDSRTYEFFDNVDDVYLVGEWLTDNGYSDTLPPEIDKGGWK